MELVIIASFCGHFVMIRIQLYAHYKGIIFYVNANPFLIASLTIQDTAQRHEICEFVSLVCSEESYN